MILQSGKEAAKRVSGFVSRRYQVHAYNVELTIREVYGLQPNGQVDFGGSEYQPAELQRIRDFKRHSQDRYTWWGLPHGAYLVVFNESVALNTDEIAVLEPLERLVRSGATHATRFVRGVMEPVVALLDVPVGKVEIKQNARISSLRVFRMEDVPSSPTRPTARKPASRKLKKTSRKKSQKKKKAARKKVTKKQKQKKKRVGKKKR